MLTTLGRTALSFMQYLGELATLAYETCVSILVAPIRWKLVNLHEPLQEDFQ